MTTIFTLILILVCVSASKESSTDGGIQRIFSIQAAQDQRAKTFVEKKKISGQDERGWLRLLKMFS